MNIFEQRKFVTPNKYKEMNESCYDNISKAYEFDCFQLSNGYIHWTNDRPYNNNVFLINAFGSQAFGFYLLFSIILIFNRKTWNFTVHNIVFSPFLRSLRSILFSIIISFLQFRWLNMALIQAEAHWFHLHGWHRQQKQVVRCLCFAESRILNVHRAVGSVNLHIFFFVTKHETHMDRPSNRSPVSTIPCYVNKNIILFYYSYDDYLKTWSSARWSFEFKNKKVANENLHSTSNRIEWMGINQKKSSLSLSLSFFVRFFSLGETNRAEYVIEMFIVTETKRHIFISISLNLDLGSCLPRNLVVHLFK